MSGNVNDVDFEKANRLGCKVLQKPVSLQKIDQIILEIEKTVPADEILMVI